MTKSFDPLEILRTMMGEAAERGIVHHVAEDAALNGRTFQVAGRSLLHFGSCSYLGLEVDERLKEGAIEAVRRYGTQFSSSRAYVSAPPYAELEALLVRIFGGEVLVTPSTSLAHLAALPVLVDADDAVIFDQQVHHSVQAALHQVRIQGSTVELLRHNQMELLAERIDRLRLSHRRVWYLADGVYSMYGNLAPLGILEGLLERFEQLHLYLDDAHGMSWSGPHGRGYVLGHMRAHERLVVATSLNKAFAAAGGALVFFDPELHRKVRICGGPMIFSGPIQPPMLGAALASARVHLSDEIASRQAGLRERIQLCNQLLAARELPIVSPSEAPIRFIGLGLPRVVYNMVARLQEDGLFTNTATFPAVPMGRSGLRFALTLHHTPEDIERLVNSLAHHLPLALEEEGSTLHTLRRTFGLEGGETLERIVPRARPGLTLSYHTTIDAVERATWDRLLGARGSFSAEALRFLEALFQGHERPEDNWSFHYFLIRDEAGVPVLATFFTETLWKDDMLSPSAISRQVEERRRHEPYFLTTRTLGMGSLLTEGEHLYLDRARDWQGALTMLVERVAELKERLGADNLVMRDFPADDAELEAFMLKQGFVKVRMPASEVMELAASSEATWVDSFGRRPRKHYRQEIAPWNDAYEVEILQAGGRVPSDEELAYLHGLYLAVKTGTLELNPFDLPSGLFATMLRQPGWELVLLRLKPAFGGLLGAWPVAVVGGYRGPGFYVPLIVGMDYQYVRSHGLYRQCLRRVILRAMELGAKRIYFGFGSDLEKKRLGAQSLERCGYFQASDHFQLDVLAQFSTATVPSA